MNLVPAKTLSEKNVNDNRKSVQIHANMCPYLDAELNLSARPDILLLRWLKRCYQVIFENISAQI